VKPQLWDYQEKGVLHLLSQPFGRPHALLADEQGTGKTGQAIEAAKLANCSTATILCPSVIKEQWRREIVRWGWAADDQIQTVYGLDAEIDNRPIVICNYDIIRDTKKNNKDGTTTKISSRNKKRLSERRNHLLILDECHRLKNHTSAQSKAVLGDKGISVNCYYKFALSGSVVPNRPAELYPLLRACAPEVMGAYGDWEGFKNYYCGGPWADGKGASNVDELTERLQPFMLRRSLADVWHEMPETFENVQWVDVPFQYHPEWIGESFMELGTVRRVVAEAKIPQLVQYLQMRFAGGSDKIVMFTYHRAVTEGVADQMHAMNPLKIYGGITNNKRDANLRKFIEDPHHKLLCMQIMSGGEGVDGLQHVTSELVLAEPEWSPGREDQAIARLRRRGQTKPILLTKLYAKNSYEEAIYWSNQDKREVIEIILKPNGGIFHTMAKTSSNTNGGILESINDKLDAILAALSGGAAPNVQPSAPAQSFAPPLPPPIPTSPPSLPAMPSLPAPPAATAPPAPPAPPALSVVPAPPTPPAPPAVLNDGEAFFKDVLGALAPLGDEIGRQVLDKLNSTFHIGRLPELAPEHKELFLQHAKAAAGNPTAYLAS
jgi:SWI/SNF-related matrix-associated actin-dependent regulator 1 of chromatin subfamily A